jgi:hypothetical protein
MLEDNLKSWMHADLPPRDMSFQLAVMTRIEQRRFRRALAANILVTLAVIMALASVMPVLQQAWQAHIAPIMSNLVIGITLMALSALLPYWAARTD